MKRLLCLLAVLSFGALTSSWVQAGPPPPFNLPTGDWEVNADGYHGKLHIQGIDPNGNIMLGSTIFNNPIAGYYDSTGARINFVRTVGGGPVFQQIYNGYLFKDTVTPLLYVLAGDFQAYQGSNVPSERSALGWYATKRLIPLTPFP